MEEIADNTEAMKQKFNSLIWECCPGHWTAVQMEQVSMGMLNAWTAAVDRLAKPSMPEKG